MNKITVKEWIEKFNNGEFDKADYETQCAAGWYDWFCSDYALAKRLKRMGNIIKEIKNDFILDNYYVWFNNNAPCCYPLYDDFRFEPLDKDKRERDEKVRSKLYFVVQCGHPYGSEYMYEICTARNNYSAEFKCRNKKEVLEAIEHLVEDFRKEINEKK